MPDISQRNAPRLPGETRIWLIGNKGMLGTEFSRLLEKQGLPFTGTDREVDVTDPAALGACAEAQSAGGRITWIVNCAAYTAVDKAEDDVESCRALNVTGPGNIARTAKKFGARLIHISTDYVFDGRGVPLAGGASGPTGRTMTQTPSGFMALPSGTGSGGSWRITETPTSSAPPGSTASMATTLSIPCCAS